VRNYECGVEEPRFVEIEVYSEEDVLRKVKEEMSKLDGKEVVECVCLGEERWRRSYQVG
jgi:hypothetical protein